MKLTEILLVGTLALSYAVSEAAESVEELKKTKVALISSTDENSFISYKVAKEELTPSSKALNVDWSDFRKDEYVGDIAFGKLVDEKVLGAQGEVDYNYLRDKYLIRKFKESHSNLKIDSKKGKEYLKFIEIDFELTMSFAARDRKMVKIIGEGPRISQTLEEWGEGYRDEAERIYKEIEEKEAKAYKEIKEIEARNRKTNEEIKYLVRETEKMDEILDRNDVDEIELEIKWKSVMQIMRSERK